MAACAPLWLAGCETIGDFGDILPVGLFDSGETSETAQLVATQRALEFLPDAETLDWVDPETGLPARVTVVSTVVSDGSYCRMIVLETVGRAAPSQEQYCRDAASRTWELKRSESA